jgi:hypothetical protein
MNTRMQRVCAWAGPVTIGLFLIGYMVIARLVPPMLPGSSATEIASEYTRHHDRLRIGLAFVIFAAPLLYAWVAAMYVQLKRVEGERSPLATTTLMSGLTLTLFLFLPLMFLEAAAYRPSRPPDVTQALNDIGWLAFIGPAGPAVLLCLALAFGMLSDKRTEPIFPRWLGYFNLWVGVTYCGPAVVWLFKSGPFAWNSIFPFWIPLAVFALWVFVNTWAVLRAIAIEASASADELDPAPEQALVDAADRG